ncbi:hypothetical protein FRC20_005821 [Serendipita sp. 405]|nr:hypothetical protein FRC20_005821 [Serendipita sp. 405]
MDTILQNPTSCEQVLQNADLLHLIIDHFKHPAVLTYSLLHDGSTLVSCTLVNRFWNYVAERILWRIIANRKPLVRLLIPSEEWRVAQTIGRGEPDVPLRMDPSVLPSNTWSRFAHYASLVTSILNAKFLWEEQFHLNLAQYALPLHSLPFFKVAT